MVANMGFNLLAVPFSYVGLAMASAMSATLNAFLLYRGLAKSKVYRFTRQSAVFFLKVLIAALIMGALIWFYCPPLHLWHSMNFFNRIHWLLWLIGLAVLAM